ncbi:hypothetical protein B566_EDAN015038 [Ephemera danica]|nr:hypothetical protein B566_EDAN015038 [Ephemera danica]
MKELRKSTTLSWKTKQKQRFLLKLCIKVLQDENDIKEILKSLLGEKKFKGNKVMNNPSYIYEQDEITGERPANLACKYGNAKFLQILLDDFKPLNFEAILIIECNVVQKTKKTF